MRNKKKKKKRCLTSPGFCWCKLAEENLVDLHIIKLFSYIENKENVSTCQELTNVWFHHSFWLSNDCCEYIVDQSALDACDRWVRH